MVTPNPSEKKEHVIWEANKKENVFQTVEGSMMLTLGLGLLGLVWLLCGPNTIFEIEDVETFLKCFVPAIIAFGLAKLALDAGDPSKQ